MTDTMTAGPSQPDAPSTRSTSARRRAAIGAIAFGPSVAVDLCIVAVEGLEMPGPAMPVIMLALFVAVVSSPFTFWQRRPVLLLSVCLLPCLLQAAGVTLLAWLFLFWDEPLGDPGTALLGLVVLGFAALQLVLPVLAGWVASGSRRWFVATRVAAAVTGAAALLVFAGALAP